MPIFSPLDRVVAASWAHSVFSLDVLERRAAPVYPPGGFPERGSSAERRASSLAGRGGLAELFLRVGWKGYVRPILPFGYLGVFDETGKPAPFYANLSHTKGVAVAVLSPSPVGIDVERLDRSAEKVLRRVATDRELAYVTGKKQGDLPLPIALWSAKEAVSKAVGLGIKFGMDVFEIDLGTPNPHLVDCRERGPLHLSQPAVTCAVRKPFVVSICTERVVLSRGVEWIDLS